MGTHIEFDRLAVPFKSAEEDFHTEDYYLLVHQVGSDNVLDADENIAKNWRYYAVGTKADVIADLARAARDIERGMVRYQNGKTKTENYIKNWRKELQDDELMSVEDFTEWFYLAELEVSQPSSVQDLPDDAREAFDVIEEEWRRTHPENRDYPIYHADISIETLRLFNTISDETAVRIDF